MRLTLLGPVLATAVALGPQMAGAAASAEVIAAGNLTASAPARAEATHGVGPGMTCVVPDGWWSLDPKQPSQAEVVKVLALKSLYTGVPGAWVQPVRGQLAGHQYQVALERLTDCH